MAAQGNNVQAAFLDAVKNGSLDGAVSILKSIHDGREALQRASLSMDPARPGGASLGALVPKIDDVRRVGDLLFDVARLQVETLDRIFGLRGKHASRLEQRLGDLMGFPVRDNLGEVLEMVVPVAAVEADRRERPTDGEATASCEIHRQFRVKNLTALALPAGPEAAAVGLVWRGDPGVAPEAVRVHVLRAPGVVPAGAVAALRLRVRWEPGALAAVNPAAEARGRFELLDADGAVAKRIDVALRFDPDGERA